MRYNKKYTFGLCPLFRTRAPKTFGTSWVIAWEPQVNSLLGRSAGNLGTSFVAGIGRGGRAVGLSPWLAESVLTPDSVRTESNCRMPSWWWGIGCCWEITLGNYGKMLIIVESVDGIWQFIILFFLLLCFKTFPTKTLKT